MGRSCSWLPSGLNLLNHCIRIKVCPIATIASNGFLHFLRIIPSPQIVKITTVRLETVGCTIFSQQHRVASGFVNQLPELAVCCNLNFSWLVSHFFIYLLSKNV